MTGTEDVNAALLNAIVDLLGNGVRTSDPETIAIVRGMQESYFRGMGDDALSSILARLQEYGTNELQATNNMLVIAEKEANQSYDAWINGSVGSSIPMHTVHKAVFSVRIVMKLDVQVQKPHKVSRFLHALFESPVDETPEGFAGHVVVETFTGSKDLSYDSSHLEWVASNVDLLLPFREYFATLGSMERSLCDSVLNSASALHSGNL